MKNPDQSLFYNKIARDFDSLMNRYDLQKRLTIVFDDLLNFNIKNKKLLDIGCGTGWFSLKACERGALVTSLDIGPNLLAETKKKCGGRCKIKEGDAQNLPLQDECFDIVLSTEVIEHTENPVKAIKEAVRVLKKGGVLVLTTPNKIWYPAILIANKLKLRPYEGLENWLSPTRLKKAISEENVKIEKFFGFHAFPFFHPIFNPVLNFLDRFGNTLSPFMLNITIKGTKQ